MVHIRRIDPEQDAVSDDAWILGTKGAETLKGLVEETKAAVVKASRFAEQYAAEMKDGAALDETTDDDVRFGKATTAALDLFDDLYSAEIHMDAAIATAGKILELLRCPEDQAQ